MKYTAAQFSSIAVDSGGQQGKVSAQSIMKFKLIRSETIYHGRVFDVRQDEVELPGGKTTLLDIVDHDGAVVIVPLDEGEKVWIVRQYRHAAGQTLMELPAGTLEAGEDPEHCVQRELREEIGMGARQIQRLGGFFLAPGYSSEFLHVYLARDLFPDPLPGDHDEIIEAETIPLQSLFSEANGGAVQDAKSLAALLLAQGHLKTDQK